MVEDHCSVLGDAVPLSMLVRGQRRVFRYSGDARLAARRPRRPAAGTYITGRISVVYAMHVVHGDAALGAGGFVQPIAMAQGSLRVAIARIPVFAHRGAAELIVLRLTFVGRLLVDQLQDGDLRQMAELMLNVRSLRSDSASSGTLFRTCLSSRSRS